MLFSFIIGLLIFRFFLILSEEREFGQSGHRRHRPTAREALQSQKLPPGDLPSKAHAAADRYPEPQCSSADGCQRDIFGNALHIC